jgi:hypothetical protein
VPRLGDRPGEGVGRVCAGTGTGELQELADDAGVAHGPSGSGFQRAGGNAVFVIGPAHTVGVDGGPRGEVLDEHVGKVELFCLLDVSVAGQCQHSRCSAAAAAVVPEARAYPAGQTGVNHGVPAPVREI